MTLSQPPKYQGIAQDLQARIRSGEWSTGDRLPSQQAMAAEYDVTLMTLRQALKELEGQGIVQAQKGRGTFVSDQPVQYRLDHLSSFAEEMATQGVSLTTEVLAARPAAYNNNVDVWARLDLPPSTAVTEVVRVRRSNGLAVALQRSYLASAHWSQISNIDLSIRSLYEALETEAGLTAARATETLRAVCLSPQDATTLERPPNTAALGSARLSLTANDRPFLYDYALLPGDATEIQTERSANGLQLSYQIA